MIATGYDWPDALGGSAVAGALDCPLLIVEPNSVPAEIIAELRRLGTTHAVVLGGTGVVGTGVTDDLLTEGISWNRLAGSNRYETAELAAAFAAATAGGGWDGTAFIATGNNFPDALAASPASAKMSYPIFLEGPGGLSAGTLQTMGDVGVSAVVLLGGEGVVSAATEAQMQAAYGAGNVTRLSGANRYATARAVAEWSVFGPPAMSPVYIAVATGENFPDALAAGPLMARRDGPLYLTAGSSLSFDSALGLSSQSMWCEEVVFMGGTGVISPTTRDAIADLMGGP